MTTALVWARAPWRSPFWTNENLETTSVGRSVELTDPLEAKTFDGAEGASVEGSHGDAERLRPELGTTERQASGNGMRPESLTYELRA